MTVTEFRELCPEYREVEGDELWNAMEDYMLAHPELMKPISKQEDKLPSYIFGILDLSNGTFTEIGNY